MVGILEQRPTSFFSTKDAERWVHEHNMCRNHRASAISVPSQLVQQDGSDGSWTWRTPLIKSQPYWQEWYKGLSDAFLAVKVPKVLMLAGADRLDRSLTIAQMQGRFQMVLVPASGHAIQEDEPEEAVSTIGNFMKRFRIGLPPLEFPTRAPGLPVVLPQAAGPLHEPAGETGGGTHQLRG
jgi:protein phosphatase methylesterase 1